MILQIEANARYLCHQTRNMLTHANIHALDEKLQIVRQAVLLLTPQAFQTRELHSQIPRGWYKIQIQWIEL